MKRDLQRSTRITAILLFGIVCLLAIGITATGSWRAIIGPRARPLKSYSFERTEARLERGRYLAENVLGCFDCHSRRDYKAPGGPIIEGTKGGGGPVDFEGMPGHLVAPNISPDLETGAGSWSDDMFARAIREGIGHDGRALFPLMPYLNYRQLSDEDLASVVVYVRSIPAVRNPLPKSKIVFPVNRLINNVPTPLTEPVAAPDVSDPAKRGAYLVQIAACTDCHTPQADGAPIAGLEFAGGFPLKGPFGEVASANITQDPSGIPYYDEAMFIKTLRTGHVGARPLNPVMPWLFFGKMTDEDLKSVFAYLKTLKPVSHRVDNAEPPTLCKICGSAHGAGNRN